MKLSLNWLNLYIHLNDIPIEELINRITMSTCEIEETYRVFSIDNNIVVGKVLECSQHPNANKLTICKVDIGKSIVQILCGASNVKEGILVAVARIGAKLNISEEISSQQITIEKRKIRGIESEGMICSARELGIENIVGDNKGILILEELPDEIYQYAFEKQNKKITTTNTKKSSKPPSIETLKKQFLKLGNPIHTIFPYEDLILDIDNKSITHRPDLWGHFGFAMELATIFNKKIQYDPLKKSEKFFQKISIEPSLPQKKIIIKDQSALAYNGIVCSNLKPTSTPLWIRILLSAIQQKCIHYIVDISNFIMYELGQPNHAFDLRSLKSDTIICALNSRKQKFIALDGETYSIPPRSIMIYDGKKPVALGGIIGGKNSAIQEDTTEIFIESATFPREYIRKTISAIGIRTESARRFEKGQDPSKSKKAIYRFVELLKNINPNLQVGNLISNFTADEIKENIIKTNLKFIQMKLGFPIEKKEIRSILKRLHFSVKFQKEQIEVKIPSFRSYYDITIPEDIVEEIGRIYGYDNIQPIAPKVVIQPPIIPYERFFERKIKYLFSSLGKFYETMNYSFSSLEDNQQFGYEGIQLRNPAQQQKDRMRVSQIPGLLEQISINIHRYEEAGLFELGKIYIPRTNTKKKTLPIEIKKLNFAYFTEKNSFYRSYIFNFEDERLGVILYVRNLIEKLLCYFHFDYQIQFPETPYFFMHPKCQIEFYHKNEIIGYLGLLHPHWYKKYHLPENKTIVIGELEFEKLYQFWNQKRKEKESSYHAPSTAPKSTFDFTILMDIKDSTDYPVQLIQNLFSEFYKIELIDIYQGSSIPENKKAVSYRIHCLDYQSISNEQLQNMLDTVVKILEKNGYPLRT